ncbi:hypothetical protein [Ligilactobacillus agilis]|uniref:hypothetical protein n=1 Tax=Ligilactobacillus agilis TaxID=1601 RepID=UPI003F8B2FAB
MKKFIGRAIAKIKATSKQVLIYVLVDITIVIYKPFSPQWAVVALALFKIVFSLLRVKD